MDITGRKLFVKALEEEGVDTIFAYPEERLQIYSMSYTRLIQSIWFCLDMNRA
nr:hypothetical protein [uncultured Eubacterium sp.]